MRKRHLRKWVKTLIGDIAFIGTIYIGLNLYWLLLRNASVGMILVMSFVAIIGMIINFIKEDQIND